MTCDSETISKAIAVGYEWRERIEWQGSAPLFPDGATFTAHVRASRMSASILATLTTAAGNLVRVDDYNMDIIIPGSLTINFPVQSAGVFLDWVRTDEVPPQYQYIELQIPVAKPITRL